LLPTCQTLRLKCTKFAFCWLLPQTQLGSLQHSPGPLAVFKGPISKGREESEEKEREEEERRGEGRM